MRTNRRGFLAALGAALGGELLLRRGGRELPAPRVEATATVFYAPPDGRNALVRFSAPGTAAPGGRLRVFDRNRRFLGTAGMIGIGGTLYGELWLPLDREAEFSTELELPGVRGAIRGEHRVRARRRWTIFSAIAADAAAVRANLGAGGPPGGAELSRAGIGVNPIPVGPDPALLDHVSFLRLMEPALDVEAAYGVPWSAVALDGSGLLDRLASAPLLLQGSGVRWVATRGGAGEGPFYRLESPDGSAVGAIPLPDGGSLHELAFAAGGEEMARRLERWLESLTPLLGDERTGLALVLGADVEEGRAAAARIAEWTARFAYPRIVHGQLSDLVARLERQPPPGLGERSRTRPATDAPGAGSADVSAREAAWRRRTDLAVAPLVARLSTSATGLAAVAEQFAFRVPGTLVFNPTPFPRTDVALMPDGTERVVTDVPPMGYASVPYPGFRAGVPGRPDAATDGRWTAIPGSENEISVVGRLGTARLDPETGAIRSLVAPANGREWVRARSEGLNAVPGVRLGRLVKLRNPGVGTRIVAERRSPDGLTLRSAVTVYEDLPWVDIANDLEGNATGPAAIAFRFALEQPAVAWEIPAGVERSPAPVDRLVHLRWLTLTSRDDVVFFRGWDAPAAAVADDGTLRSLAPPRRSRYRVGFASGFSAPDDPWRFGWGTEPLATASVPGTGGARLPSFGALVVVDQTGVALLELRPARNGEGIVVYLQELLGVTRDLTLGSGLLAFHGGRRIDFLERDLGPLPTVGATGVAVPIRANGIVAVRLTGVELAGA